MSVKTKVIAVLTSLGVVTGVFYFRSRQTTTPILNVYTWSSYFPDSIISEFTRETGIEVRLSYFSSNEELFSKLKAGATGFDIIQPSDYMVRTMQRNGMLVSLDHSKLPNLSHLDDYYRHLPYDPQLKYSVPFTWGTTGIAVNTRRVKVPAEGVPWHFLIESSDPKHTSLLDDAREVFTAFLLSSGQPFGTHDPATLKVIQARVQESIPKILTFTSEPKQLLLRGELTIAHIFSADGIQAHMTNPDIEYFIPLEGGTLWTDNFAIPTTATHPFEAHRFIDYFLNPDNALKLITENHLSTPNATAKDRLPKAITANPNLYPPPEILARMHFMEDPEESLVLLNRLWTELKS